MSIPKRQLNDGNQIPIVGLGTSQTHDEITIQAVKDAIDIGYRHIDCAHIYGNEKDVGIGLNAKIREGVVTRSDLFITSKLWNTFHRPGIVEHALRKTLSNLGVDYIDLYLIHWPIAFKEDGPLNPTNPEEVEFADYDYVNTWKSMEEVKKKGLAKSIGISNFNKSQIERLIEKAEIIPTVNQVECHPYFTQNSLIQFCQAKNIQIVAFSPFASPGRFENNPNYPKLLEDPRLKAIATKYSRSPAQIVLKWQIQRNVIVLPKSVHKNRLQENFNVFDFEITNEDMSIITAFNSNFRFLTFSVGNNSPYYPFNEEY